MDRGESVHGHAGRLSVVVPHLNQPHLLDRCLASLAEGRRKPDEIVVVDNGSDFLPRDICAAYDGVTLLVEPIPGPGPARNLGAARACGEILAFIDADCHADPGWLETAEAALRDPEATILGGDVRIALRDPNRPTIIEAYESEFAYRMDRYIAHQGFTGTGNLVVRRAVFEDVGTFAGLEVAEDRAWGQSATRKGYTIRYVAAMRVYHPARSDFAGIFRKWDRQIAHDLSEARGGRAFRLRWAAKALALVVSPLFEIPRIARSRRLSGLRSRLLCLAGLTRIRLYRALVMGRLLLHGDRERLAHRWNRS